ncbi:MAG: electron transfer flavoprotein subunit beta/FixA family protein [Promethearchaeota archaeon]
MKIIVCIKQVPGTSEVDMDENGNLIRDPSNSKMNPFDLFALETALQIKQQLAEQNVGCETVAISMGPPAAETVLREAIYMGVDSGVLITDRKFAGSDVWATSYTLAQAIKTIEEPSIIVTGKQTTDGDTAQVGAEIAEFLNMPHITNVISIENVKRESIIVKAILPTEIQTAEITYPCLITVEKDVYTPRLPSYRRKLEHKSTKIEKIAYRDLPDKNEYHYGSKGSPTQVVRVFLPDESVDQEVWNESEDQQAQKLFDKLVELKFI